VTRQLERNTRIEWWASLAGLALAVVASVFLVATNIVAKENCYGLSAGKLQCQTLTAENAGPTAARITVVLSTVLFLYVAGLLAARWQARTRKKDARVTAYMLLVTCAVTTLALVLPTIQGTGFYFLPSSLLLLVATGFGLPALLGANRDPARNDPEEA
jgi:asparagine N-glycosylation enzyme membrane subunit Stt3